MRVGFTGTRKGMTAAQRAKVIEILGNVRPYVIVHGGAVGADEEFDRLVNYGFCLSPWGVYGQPGIMCEVYPASTTRFCFWRWRNRAYRLVHPPLDPLKRNRIIVNTTDRMIATPAEAEEQSRGGTWSTIRYARKIGKPITVIGPDGSVI